MTSLKLKKFKADQMFINTGIKLKINQIKIIKKQKLKKLYLILKNKGNQ